MLVTNSAESLRIRPNFQGGDRHTARQETHARAPASYPFSVSFGQKGSGKILPRHLSAASPFRDKRVIDGILLISGPKLGAADGNVTRMEQPGSISVNRTAQPPVRRPYRTFLFIHFNLHPRKRKSCGPEAKLGKRDRNSSHVNVLENPAPRFPNGGTLTSVQAADLQVLCYDVLSARLLFSITSPKLRPGRGALAWLGGSQPKGSPHFPSRKRRNRGRSVFDRPTQTLPKEIDGSPGPSTAQSGCDGEHSLRGNLDAMNSGRFPETDGSPQAPRGRRPNQQLHGQMPHSLKG